MSFLKTGAAIGFAILACTPDSGPVDQFSGAGNPAAGQGNEDRRPALEYLQVNLYPGIDAPARFLRLGYRTPGIFFIEDEEGVVEFGLSALDASAFNELVASDEFGEIDDRRNPCPEPPRLALDVTVYELAFQWTGDEIVRDSRPDACLSEGNSVIHDLLIMLTEFWKTNLVCPPREPTRPPPIDPSAGRTACYDCLDGCGESFQGGDSDADSGLVTGGTLVPVE